MFKEWGQYLLAILQHWKPLATGAAALVVSLVMGHFYGEHAPTWVWVSIILFSIFIASFLAWREIKRDKDKAKRELDVLNTPSVSIELHKIEETVLTHNDTQTLFLKVTGKSAAYIRPEVFVIRAEPIKEGHYTLERFPGTPPSFGVHRGEEHPIRAVIYKDKQMLLNCELACKIAVADTVRGKEFNFLVRAYGGPKEAELEFRLGVEDGALWAEQVGSTKRLKSHLREMIDKIYNQGD